MAEVRDPPRAGIAFAFAAAAFGIALLVGRVVWVIYLTP